MKQKGLIVELAEVIARHWPGRDHIIRRLARALVPHPGTFIFTLLAVGAILFAQQAGALPFRAPTLADDSTTTISYQGRLADSSGAPVDSAGIGMQFCLYDIDVGGSPLWCEDHLSVPVEDGLFHVLLGSRSDGIPVSIFATHTTLWLGITVDGDSEMAPREQIASVPYAMIASTVADGAVTTEKIADEAVTQAKLGSDVSLDPADGSVTTAKIADGAVTSAKLEHSGSHIPITPDENGLVKMAVLRQDDTTDSYVANQVILTGWGWKAGTGGNWMSESVSFGVTFSDTPIVLVSGAGEITTSDPTSLEDFGVDSNAVLSTAFVSTTGFTVVYKRLNEANIPTSSRVGYTWIAIGTLE